MIHFGIAHEFLDFRLELFDLLPQLLVLPLDVGGVVDVDAALGQVLRDLVQTGLKLLFLQRRGRTREFKIRA